MPYNKCEATAFFRKIEVEKNENKSKLCGAILNITDQHPVVDVIQLQMYLRKSKGVLIVVVCVVIFFILVVEVSRLNNARESLGKKFKNLQNIIFHLFTCISCTHT